MKINELSIQLTKPENNDKISLKKAGGIEKHEVKLMEMWEGLGLALVVKMGLKPHLAKLKGENAFQQTSVFFNINIYRDISYA